MEVDEFFAGEDLARQLFDSVYSILTLIGPVEFRPIKSQISFRKRKAFAWVWMPGKYLHGKVAPLVLSLAFNRKDVSPRWKEIYEPTPGQFMHHLELYSPSEIDEQVHSWLQEAWTNGV